jgi:type II secretory pathway pseudopilin PulG
VPATNENRDGAEALSLRTNEEGFGLVELLVAVAVLTIALLALMAGYDTAAVSLRSSSSRIAASALADAQMELFSSLPYTSMGLDTTTLAAVENAASASYDSRYVSDEAGLDNAANATDATVASCGSGTNCLPIQTVTGSNGHRYRIETFVRDVQNNVSIRWTVREVTVIVEDAQLASFPEVLRTTTAFDRGP